MSNTTTLFDILQQADDKQNALSEYLKNLTSMKRIPHAVSLELTPICNLNCEICYIKRTQQEVIDSGSHVMSFSEWKYYIDGLNAIGVYNFTLTGGECMLHPDFIKIYEYIYDLGKKMALITNGTCLNEKILHCLRKQSKLPPNEKTMPVCIFCRQDNA